jgi:hypothetical protein
MLLKQLLRLLTLFALLVAPLGMLGGNAAAAAPPSADAGASSGHCAEMAGSHDPSDEQEPAQSVECMDCMIVCSGMLSVAAQLTEPLAAARLTVAALRSPLVRGLTPQAEPRPPRFS